MAKKEHIIGEAVYIVDLLNIAEEVPTKRIEFFDEHGDLWCIFKQKASMRMERVKN